MALPKRGTRKLVYEGQSLRWKVTPKSKHYVFVAESYDRPGQRLVMTVARTLFPVDVPAFTPGVARQCVGLAVSGGFDVDAPRGEHRMSVEPGQLDFTVVDRENMTKRPVGRPRKRAPGEKRAPVYVSLEPADRARLKTVAEREGIGLGTLVRQWVVERLDVERV